MDRISVLARRRRIKNLEQWTMYAILAESFFLALSPTFAAAAIMIGVVTWFLRNQIDSKYKIRSLPFDVPVTIFLLIGAASVLMSSVRSFALIYNYCMLVGIYALTYFVVGQTIRTPEQVKQMAQALAAGAVIVVLYALFQILFGVDAADVKWTDPEAFPQLKKRIFSTLENPNVLAGYLDVFICLALGLLAKVEQRSQKLILIVAIITLACCLTMTYSRGAFLTIAVVFAVYAFLQDWRVLIVFAAVTGIISFTDTTFTDRIFSAFNMGDSSEGVRLGIWVSTTAMISDHPFAGIGWGAYQYVYPQYNYYIADNDITIYHAHNIYLNFAAEVGIVGALAFFWYFFGTMFMSLALGANERYAKIRDGVENLADRQASNFSQRAQNVLDSSGFLRAVTEIKDALNARLSAFADAVTKLLPFGKKPLPTLKVKKPRKSYREVVHHEDLNFSEHTRKKFADGDKTSADGDGGDDSAFVDGDEKVSAIEKISVGGEKISVKRVRFRKSSATDSDVDTDKKPFIDWNGVTKLDDEKFLDGFKLGIGLAFLSMALNGLTDDLLFNIPSAILMWQLGALGAAINSIRN
ncbi:MAG: O-antigen ligase family protein [Selenomonadaceae bacterium]|nr:O-antigen ligase family protein [Selenomonadaceae bacterium]